MCLVIAFYLLKCLHKCTVFSRPSGHFLKGMLPIDKPIQILTRPTPPLLEFAKMTERKESAKYARWAVPGIVDLPLPAYTHCRTFSIPVACPATPPPISKMKSSKQHFTAHTPRPAAFFLFNKVLKSPVPHYSGASQRRKLGL
jgi:hypothetical protein